MTDYEQYAGIFTCQKLPVGHRQSATILSRTKDLEPAVLNKIRTRISSFQVDPFDLSIISQSKCPKLDDESGYNIAIDGNTFSAQNIGSWVKSAGTKIGEGVEWTVSDHFIIFSIKIVIDDKIRRTLTNKTLLQSSSHHVHLKLFITLRIAFIK